MKNGKKSKGLSEESNLSKGKSKLHDPLDDLKDFNFKEISPHRKPLKSKKYDDLDEKFNKRFEELDKNDDFLSLSETKQHKTNEDEEKNVKNSSDLDDLITSAHAKISHHFSQSSDFDDDSSLEDKELKLQEDLGDKNSKKNPFRSRFSEIEDERNLPKKYSEKDREEELDSYMQSKEDGQQHHSQAYLRHLEQIKKQKATETAETPSQKDPILGNFVKNLQSIASGDNATIRILFLNLINFS